MFKEKIIAAIKAKFPKLNLSKTRLNAIAVKIEKKVVDDETKIDAAIDDYNEVADLEQIAKDDDALRTANSKLKEIETAGKGKPGEKPEDKPVIDDDAPAWAKTLLKQNETLAGQVAAMQGEKVANTIRSKATEKLKDIPVSYWAKRAIPDKEEELDAFVDEVKADYGTFKQEMTNEGLDVLSQAKPSGGKAGDVAKTISPEIKAFVEKNTPAPAAKV